MSTRSLLRRALGLRKTVVEGAEETTEGVVVSVRPKAGCGHRCPRCGRRAPHYDSLGRRRWRALDLGGAMCWVEADVLRVSCPEHGVVCEAVPWARHHTMFCRAFEDQVAWLACHCCMSVVSELMRVDWHTVGGVCRRVEADLDAERGRSRLEGLRRLGVDETSYKKGHRYMTVVVDHDTGAVVWAARGCGKAVLRSFFRLLTREQRLAIEVVTADGARWIKEVVRRWCPNAEQVMDPFHVVSWAQDALDSLRRRAWNDARREFGARSAEARAVKGTRWALAKNPEDLTAGQEAALDGVARSDARLWKAYLCKEALRDVFKAGAAGEAASMLDAWMARYCRSRVPELVELTRKVRRRRDDVVRAVSLGISNARVESVNNKIKLAVRMGYGFRNIDNLIALVMLRCSDLKPRLPGRQARAGA